VEARQDLGRVLGRDDLRELDDGGEAEAPGPEPRFDLGEPPDQLRRGLPVLGGPGGEAELAAQEGEEARVAEVAPQVW
jgi:hypothetical protein